MIASGQSCENLPRLQKRGRQLHGVTAESGMMDGLAAAQAWVMGLGAQYGVNPVIFGAIYIGAIPFFLLFTGLAIKRLRGGRPAVLPILGAGLCFISAYLYLAIVGRNIPGWVWGVFALIIAYGGFSAIRGFRAKLKA